MATEDREDGAVTFAVPNEVDDWLEAEADRRNEDRDAVCKRLLTAVHRAATDGSVSEPADREDLAQLRAQLDAQREEFADLLEDVRGCVVQVKRETDGKAPADHDHPELAAEGALEDVRADLRRLEDELDDLEATTDAGFENFEEILEHLIDETDELAERAAVLARAVVDLRDHRDALAARERRRSEAEQLQLAAARLGVRTADCEACGAAVDIGLLTAPECPHCASGFSDVREKTSLFGSHTLETGDPPELEGRAAAAIDPEDGGMFEAVAADLERDDDREGPG